MKLPLSLLSTLLMFSFGTPAEARILCAPNATSCYFADMPLYNQNAVTNGGMSCGPTAAAMGLQGVVYELAAPENLKPASYTAQTFIANTPSLTFKQRQEHQIRALEKLLNTSTKTGTGSNVMYKALSGRTADFVKAGGANTGYPIAYPNQNYINYVKNDKSATTLLYGHYSRTSSTSNGKTYYNYTRKGGHFVTVNGYSGTKLLTYDPWGGVRAEREIAMVKGGCVDNICQNLPGAKPERALLFGTYKFVDHHTRLWAD